MRKLADIVDVLVAFITNL